MTSSPQLRREGPLWIFEHQGLRAEFSHLRQESGGTYGGLNGEVRISTTLPGVQPHLHEARLNLSSTNARETIIKTLVKRGGEGLTEVGIADFVEMACVLTMRAFRQGEPFKNLAHVSYSEPQFAIQSLFPLHKRCQLYAPAENFKTTLMLAMLMQVATGEASLGFEVQQSAVAYLDWETDENDASNLWHRLALGKGLSTPPDLYYRRCKSPVWHEAESAAVEFAREGVGFCLLDSAFWACGGNPNNQENVGGMFEGIDALGPITTVLLNHTGSSETEKTRRRHYGLEHFRNAVRASWELRKAETPGTTGLVSLGLYRDKLNMRRPEGPFGFEVIFDGDSGPIYVQRRDESIVDVPELDESRPATDRVLDELAHGRATMKQLIAGLNLPEGTLKSAIHRLGKTKVRGRSLDKGYFYELVAHE